MTSQHKWSTSIIRQQDDSVAIINFIQSNNKGKAQMLSWKSWATSWSLLVKCRIKGNKIYEIPHNLLLAPSASDIISASSHSISSSTARRDMQISLQRISPAGANLRKSKIKYDWRRGLSCQLYDVKANSAWYEGDLVDNMHPSLVAAFYIHTIMYRSHVPIFHRLHTSW